RGARVAPESRPIPLRRGGPIRFVAAPARGPLGSRNARGHRASAAPVHDHEVPVPERANRNVLVRPRRPPPAAQSAPQDTASLVADPRNPYRFAMARLRRVSPTMRGWTRRRAGKGFVYLDSDGQRLPPEEVERIRSLAIPPAWRDVWICPLANGHLQAVGTD